MTAVAERTVARAAGDESAARRGRRPRVARWRPAAAVGAIVLAVVLSQSVAGAVLLAAGGSRALMALGVVLADVVVLAVVVVFARRGADRLTPATLGIRRTRLWRAVAWMLAIYVGVIGFEGLWTVLVAALGGVHGRGGGAPAVHASTPVALLILLALAVVAPIAEEISFRGYLFPALSRWRGPWSAAVLTALLFGAAHVLAYPPLLLPLMVAFGFGSCLLYWITGSLLPCVALHALNNALVTSIALGWGWQVPLAVVGCAATALGLLAPWARQRAPQVAAQSA